MVHTFMSPSALLILFCLLLSGCTSTKQNITATPAFQSSTERIEQTKAITQWQVYGKIAFIEESKRESATLNWQVNDKKNSQQLNLTSYLGINVLQLVSHQNQHKLSFDGQSYQTDDLKTLIYSLTGLTLPTQALSSWIKGLAFQENDQISYDSSHLPTNLTSYYQNAQWEITYSHYKQIKHYVLPSRLTIKTNDLLIKIVINQWKNVE